jgi:hypothetical protein
MSELRMASRERLDELEDRAYRDEAMPEGLGYPEELLYQKFRCLYALARMGKVTREEGKREKDRILADYRKDCTNVYVFEVCNGMLDMLHACAEPILQDERLMREPKVVALLKVVLPVSEVDAKGGKEP